MANMRDVAKKAGVGLATVSRYINNEGYVSDKVREKIQKAINELNYKPNALARAIFTKSSKMLGLIIPNIVNPVYPEFATGIENQAREKGYNIVLCNTEYERQNEQKGRSRRCGVERTWRGATLGFWPWQVGRQRLGTSMSRFPTKSMPTLAEATLRPWCYVSWGRRTVPSPYWSRPTRADRPSCPC